MDRRDIGEERIGPGLKKKDDGTGPPKHGKVGENFLTVKERQKASPENLQGALPSTGGSSGKESDNAEISADGVPPRTQQKTNQSSER